MNKTELLYEGKGKKIFKTDDENVFIAEFKDDLTAFNALKKGSEVRENYPKPWKGRWGYDH